MPEVVIYALGGRSVDAKRGLVKDVTAAVVNNLGVSAGTVVVTLIESEKVNKGKGGVLLSDMPPPVKST